MQEKEIQIVNLTSKHVEPRPGQTFRPFTVYTIEGNDGVRYEVINRKDYFDSVKIGQNISIKYSVESKNVGGKIYTKHVIDLPKKIDPGLVILKREIFEKIELVERNIIEAIKYHAQNYGESISVKSNPHQPSLYDEDDIGVDVPPDEEEENPY